MKLALRPAVLVSLVVASSLLAWGHLRLTSPRQYAFVATLSTSAPGLAQLFYDVSGRGFAETRSVHFPLSGKPEPQTFAFPIPAGNYQGLRFDPVNSDAAVTITDAHIVNEEGEVLRRFSADDFSPLHDIGRLEPRSDGTLEILPRAGGYDPYLKIALEPPLRLPALDFHHQGRDFIQAALIIFGFGSIILLLVGATAGTLGTAGNPGSFSPIERWWVGGAFFAYLIFQVHAAFFHGYQGQDWITHFTWISQASEHPWNFLTRFEGFRTNPPMYHLLGGMLKNLTSLRNFPLALGLMNVALGFAGMCFAYAVMRRLIASAVIRISCLVLLLFLPFAMVHAQVVASDALSTPLFWALVWLVLVFPASGSATAFAKAAILLGVLLLFSLLVKFTFGSFILGVAVWSLALWWTKVLPPRRLAVMLGLVFGIPAAAAYALSAQFNTQTQNPFGLVPPTWERLTDGEMNLRSLAGLRPADIRIFDAPSYNSSYAGEFDLLQSNKHSFAALLHLGMFTDILNVYQYDPYDQYFGQRTVRNHHLMQAAVCAGVAASVVALTGVVFLFCRTNWEVLVRRRKEALGVFVVLLFSLAWFFNVVSAFPFLPAIYADGFWLPRLVTPALIGFFICGFIFLERLARNRPTVACLALAGALALSFLHASFLWPYRSENAPLYEPDLGIAGSTAPVLRVFDWQDNNISPSAINSAGTHGLDRTIGVVVNLPAAVKSPKTWRLGFTAAVGSANPSPRRSLRVSAKNFPATTIEFDGSRDINLDIPLAAGRNDIVLELLSPLATDEHPRPDIVLISNLRVQPTNPPL